MNYFTELSIKLANQNKYLDELFQVYPTIPEGIRDIDNETWNKIETAFKNNKKSELIRLLLSLELFPIKDSYIAYLKRDPGAIERNPGTIDRIYGRLEELGIDKIRERITQPKETNRQIGPMFKRWINKVVLGAPIYRQEEEFLKAAGNAIFDGSDTQLANFARRYLNYTGSKGLDLVAKFNNKYVVGEAKFLTDFGGHQNAQFNDAMALLANKDIKAEKIAILDGVLYIKGKNKMYRDITTKYSEHNIMSALVLREFLYQI